MAEPDVDILILGGGLAGLCTAYALVDEAVSGEPDDGIDGSDICVLDAHNPHRGSSSPCGMLHPFPGPSMAPGDHTFEKVRTSLNLIRDLDRTDDASGTPAPTPLLRELPMLRPVDDSDRGDRLVESWQNHRDDYPTWLDSDWLDQDDLDDQYPALQAARGAIRYSPAASVRIGELRDRLIHQLRSSGAAVHRHTTAATASLEDSGWRVELDDGCALATNSLVWAAGNALADWFDLPAGPRAGEVVITEPQTTSLGAAVSAGGYVAPIPSGPETDDSDAENEQWLAGATWFDPEAIDTRDDHHAIQVIRNKTSRLVPWLDAAHVETVWRGVRFMLGHIAGPLVGAIPGLPNGYVAGAFGSKGLLRIPWATRQLANSIVHPHASVPPDIRPDRLDDRWWTPNANRIDS